MQMPSLNSEQLLGLIRFGARTRRSLAGTCLTRPAYRFGADAVLKSEGADLTDADIDTLIQRGETKTSELAKKLQADCQHSLATTMSAV